jgi:hypothetical protein
MTRPDRNNVRQAEASFGGGHRMPDNNDSAFNLWDMRQALEQAPRQAHTEAPRQAHTDAPDWRTRTDFGSRAVHKAEPTLGGGDLERAAAALVYKGVDRELERHSVDSMTGSQLRAAKDAIERSYFHGVDSKDSLARLINFDYRVGICRMNATDDFQAGPIKHAKSRLSNCRGGRAGHTGRSRHGWDGVSG